MITSLKEFKPKIETECDWIDAICDTCETKEQIYVARNWLIELSIKKKINHQNYLIWNHLLFRKLIFILEN